ncbi:MAG TPA: DUF4416 family protein [Pirellulaceae bacterium]|nr:DUF4416 family protein [Pirellulaceae bacterium]
MSLHPPIPALLFVAHFSRHEAALEWSRRRIESAWGEIVLASPLLDFSETRFYERTMGTGIRKQLLAIAGLRDQGDLPKWKLEAIGWEDEYRAAHDWPEPRPLNIDPGYVTEAKLVLGTTKDRDHRIYLSQGIYAETTVYHQHGGWKVREWTYPDYRRPDYHQFLDRCREYLRGLLAR